MSSQAAAVILLWPALAGGAQISQPAEQAFAAYTADLEARVAGQRAAADTYLAVLDREGEPQTDVGRELRTGAIHIEPVNGGSRQVAGGLLHHWRAAALVAGATAQEMLALLGDYNHLDRYYQPDVVCSRALAGGGEKATVAMRFKAQKIVTVVLDAEFATESALSGPGRGYSISRSTHIWQVDGAGSPQEQRREEGNDDGFLWRLNSYWNFAETPEGLLIECETVSLTRGVPAGLGWLIMPIIEALPRASLEFTMTATRNALGKRNQEAQ